MKTRYMQGIDEGKFRIYDWAGNDLTQWHGTFKTFEDAWDYIFGEMTERLKLTEEDYQEFEVYTKEES